MADGERLLPEGWVDLVRTSTEGSGGRYGMGFWLPADHDGLPAGTFFMSGFQSQFAYIMPAEDLVVVRFGATNGVNAGGHDLARSVVAALQPAANEPGGG